MPCTVDILLACYQGEAYLRSQLDSLFLQSYSHFRVLARDDGSTDQTYAILQDYAKRYPEKIHIIPSGTKLGVVGNFNALLEVATADFVFFCDQDDVWKENKIELSLKNMEGVSGPLLLHTDLEIVDEKMQVLHPSFLSNAGINPKIGKTLNRLLVQNMVTGCTVAINKPLRELVYPFPKQTLMHDWWMALTAAACGQIITILEPTVLYRQHSQNVIGAKRHRGFQLIKKLFNFLTSLEANTDDANLRQKQAGELHKRFHQILSEDQLAILNHFLIGPKLSLMQRKLQCIAHQFYRQGMKKIIPYLLQNRPY